MATSVDSATTGSASYSSSSGVGNIFIKNLDKAIDNKSLYDIFSLFGNILSCKVAVDDEGKSKGYGFVHFEKEEAAHEAVQKADGMTLAGKEIFVGKFQPRAQRQRELGENLFVKNFGEDIDDDKLRKMFQKFGEITSCAVMRDAGGKSKGFGFVSFKKIEDAEKSIKEMHEKIVVGSDKKLFVSRAQKKSDRQAELKKMYEEQKTENVQKMYEGVNLYVKNLDETIDNEKLKEIFDSFGKITSIKVMTDENGRSKGFGFVCFENDDDATKAIKGMNSKMVCSKPLYVAIAQRKSDRRAQLASQFMHSLASMRMRNDGISGNTYTPGQETHSTTQDQTGSFPGSGVAGANWSDGMNTVQHGGWDMQGQQYNLMLQHGGVHHSGSPPHNDNSQHFVHGAVPTFNSRGAQNHSTFQGHQVDHRAFPNDAIFGAHALYYHQYPYLVQAQPHHPYHQAAFVAQDPLNPHMLSQSGPMEQKQLLGERIFALIQKMYPGMMEAGKITGMMLEMDNAELIMILQDANLFRSKVAEAVSVFQKSFKKKKAVPSLMQSIRT